MGACHVARGRGGSEYSLKDDRALTGTTYEAARIADRRHLLLELGLPTFGLSFAISVLTTYAPVVLIDLVGSTSQVGVLLAAEGAFALAVPLLVGSVSDRPSGAPASRRFPFIEVGAPLVVLGLLLLPLLPSIPVAAISVLAFFIGYYVYYPPYRALYADLLPPSEYARSQSEQAVLRGVGLGAALLSGGLLLRCGSRCRS
jgi:maltose/moltooligosaccharide transporter